MVPNAGTINKYVSPAGEIKQGFSFPRDKLSGPCFGGA